MGRINSLREGFGALIGHRKLPNLGRRRWYRAAGSVRLEPLEGRLLFSTYTVTTAGDGNGTVTSSGAGTYDTTTLRAAINAANAHAGPDLINFAVNGIIRLASALPPIDNPVSISGPGVSDLTIEPGAGASTNYSVFDISAGTAASIVRLTIVGGAGTTIDGTPIGGGIDNNGQLTLNSVNFRGNSASAGGALENAGTLNAAGCAFYSNSAQVGGAVDNTGTASFNYCAFSSNSGGLERPGGGAVSNSGTLTIDNCTLSGNQAGGGGAIYSDNGAVTLNHTAVSENASDGINDGGGGIESDSTTLTLVFCTVSGNSAGPLTSGGGIDSASGSVTLNSCTVSGNFASSGDGGGIRSGGPLVIDNSTISGNSGRVGGGIECTDALTIADSTISNNAGDGIEIDGFNSKATLADSTISANAGSGIDNFGVLSLANCTLSKNKESSGLGGGALNNRGSATLANCTLSDNAASGLIASGGAVFNIADLDLIDCTLSGNLAYSSAPGSYPPGTAGAGGGICNDGAARLSNCTLFGNNADAGGAIDDQGAGNLPAVSLALTNCTITANSASIRGGGIANTVGALTLSNTLVAGNVRGKSTPDDISTAGGSGNVNPSSSFNLIGTGGAGGLVNGANGNKVGVADNALKLGNFGYYGGLTETVSLLPGSPAIDAGSNAMATAAGLYADQRGMPQISNGRVDIGAFESQIPGGGSIAGDIYDDLNHDGAREADEPGLANGQVYIDQNDSGAYVAGDITTFANAAGDYKFTGLAPGTYIVREVWPSGWTQTEPAGADPSGDYKVIVNPAGGQGVIVAKDFGNYLS